MHLYDECLSSQPADQTNMADYIMWSAKWLAIICLSVSLFGKNFIFGHYVQTFQPYSCITAML